ncbi:MAG: DUF4116 domain-containing protein [Treponema sp.]|nr:DUF4116 domain-containing protein [Treponema sp.]
MWKKRKIRTEKQALAAVYWGEDSDFRDIPADLKTLKVCLAAAQRFAHTLEYVPEIMKTPEVCLIAVKRHDLNLEFVPVALKTAELCLAAMQNGLNGGRVIDLIPSSYFDDPEFCFEVVQRYGPAIERVPDSLKTAELCFIAVQQRSRALEYIPESLKTAELCAVAVNNGGWGLEYVPEALKTSELCLSALDSSDLNVEHIPSKLFENFEFCIAAVKKYACVLKYVPEAFKTAELCHTAVQQYGAALEYIPEVFKTAELCRMAVYDSVFALEHVPESLKTTELCIATVRGGEHGWASISSTSRYIPADQFENEEFCLALVKSEGRALEYVPETLRTREICLAAVQKDGQALEYVPEALRTEEICTAAAKQEEEDEFPWENNDNTLENVPEMLKTAELCLASLQHNRAALKYVPKELIDGDFLLAAVKRNCQIFIDIPEEQITEELCLVAAAGFNEKYCHDSDWMEKFFTLVPDKYVKKVKETMRNAFYTDNKDLLTKREVHFFTTPKVKNNDSRSPLFMFFEAKCKARGIPDLLTREIAGAFSKKLYKNYQHITVISFLDLIARQKDYVIDEEELAEICEFLDSEIIKYNEKPEENAPFSCKGRTMSSVSAISNEWHVQKNAEELFRYGIRDKKDIKQEWEGLSVKNIDPENSGYVWNITQLCSVNELVNEGRVMKHCAAAYAHRCSKGETAIFHFAGHKKDSSKNKFKKATVELLIPSRTIVQIKGKCNTKVDGVTIGIVKEWAQYNNFRMFDYL